MAAQRVLVVDDDPDFVNMISDFLSTLSESFCISRASDGQAAVDAVQRETPDLVMLDVKMPVMDGMEALKRILAIAPRLPVLMVTGGESSSASQALRMGAFGYLPKPMDLRYVGHLVSLALGTTQRETVNA